MAEQKLIENYGFVPFYFFQYIILGLQIWMIYNHEIVNEYMDKIFDKQSKLQQNIKKIILTLPLLSVMYYDIRYSSFSFKNLGVPPEYNDTIKQILNIMGSYALIHIFAQDTGFKTSLLQIDILQSHLLFVVSSVGMAYSLTQNRSQSIIALLMFYHLKYVLSNNMMD